MYENLSQRPELTEKQRVRVAALVRNPRTQGCHLGDIEFSLDNDMDVEAAIIWAETFAKE